MEWEIRIIELIQKDMDDISRILNIVFSFIGGEMGLMVLIVVTLFCFKKEVGQRLALIVASLHIWFSSFKAIVKRPRPYIEYPERVKAFAPADPEASPTDVVAQGYSFPSMHSGAVPASYFTVAKHIGKKWAFIAAGLLTFFVGFCRIATANHYPSDVLAGWIMGFMVLGIFELLDRHVKKEEIRYLILLLSALPGIFFVRTSEYYTSLGLLIGTILAIPFERRYVNYQETESILAMVLRPLGGFAIYFSLNALLKLPFSKQFLESEMLTAFLVRTIRYVIIIFVIMAVYPKIFPLFEKKDKK